MVKCKICKKTIHPERKKLICLDCFIIEVRNYVLEIKKGMEELKILDEYVIKNTEITTTNDGDNTKDKNA